jgi:3-hydroxyisobutyrate dehydrogenase
MKISPGQTRIGWIGTGVMGSSMCGHILDAGYPVTVFTRTRSKAESLIARGARWADTPRDVAADSDIVFSIVGYPRDVREVLIGDRGALRDCRPGCVIVDMATSPPVLSQEIADMALKQGVASIDAPVTGGDVGARNGTLSIMIGGAADTVAALEPMWKLMGSKWIHHGGPGAGQHAKIVNQVLVCAHMIGLCEAFVYAQRSGLELEKVFESVASGAAGSWALSNLGPRMIQGNFAPGFFAEHLLKDIGIALEESRRMNLKMPGLELAERLYKEHVALGHAKDGTHSLILTVAKSSGIEWQTTERQ